MIIKIPNNKHIETAIDYLDDNKELVNEEGIDSTFKSYISSFGGSIIQSGLMGTLMTFEANANKAKIINALFALYNTNFPNATIVNNNQPYYKVIKSKTDAEKKEIRNKLIEMAVALKLAMRCFKTTDNNTPNSEDHE